MSQKTIKTNRFYFNVDWTAFFQRFQIFYITVSCKKEKHRSIYDLLSQIPANGNPISVAYGWALEGGLKKEFFLMAPKDSRITRFQITNALRSNNFTDCAIEELNEGDQMPSIEKIANLLLSFLPNYDSNICYADGQLYIGNCLGWNKHYARHGELTFLHISFSNGGLGTVSIDSEAVTFTEEDKIKNSKYYHNYNLSQMAKLRPFYINYTTARVFASRLKDADATPFYKMKVYARQNDNNRIDFLNYKDEKSLASCQAAIIPSVIDVMQNAYGDFITLEQIVIDAECYETKAGSSHLNKIEEKYMRDFLGSSTFAVKVYDPKSPGCKDTATATIQALSALDLRDTHTISDNSVVLRVLPSWVNEKMGLEDASEAEKARVKRSQCADKLQYQR